MFYIEVTWLTCISRVSSG